MTRIELGLKLLFNILSVFIITFILLEFWSVFHNGLKSMLITMVLIYIAMITSTFRLLDKINYKGDKNGSIE